MLPATVLVATQGEGMESVRSMLTSGYRVTPGKANSTGFTLRVQKPSQKVTCIL